MEATLNKLTPYQAKKKKKEQKLFADYQRLIADPQQSRLEVMKFLAGKYGYESIQGVYRVVNRVRKSIQQ